MTKRVKISDFIEFENIVKSLKDHERNLKNETIYAMRYRLKKCFTENFKGSFKGGFKGGFKEGFKEDFEKDSEDFSEKN